MAEGDTYDLRKSTLNQRLETETEEEERLRRRLQQLEMKNKREEELVLLREQRERLRHERLINRQQSTPFTSVGAASYITVDDDNDDDDDVIHQRTVDLTAETRKLDDKLKELQRTKETYTYQCPDGQRKETQRRDDRSSDIISRSRIDQLERSIRKLSEDIEFDVPKPTDRKSDMARKGLREPTIREKDREGTYLPYQSGGIEDGIARLTAIEERLKIKEDNLKRKELEVDEQFRKREQNLLKWEEKLEHLQERIDTAFREKEGRLLDYKRQLDEEQRMRRLEEREKMEKDLLDKWKHDLMADRSRCEQKPLYVEPTYWPNEYAHDGNSCHPPLLDHPSAKLNLTTFSGKEPVPRHESSFEEFKLEFESVRHVYSEHVLRQALMKALKDQARKTMLHLGTDVTVDRIMKSLEENFGNVASGDSVMSRFLLAEQNTDESIVEWGLRLEDMLLQVCRKFRMDDTERKERLKNRFWRGLRNDELRQATRSYFDSPMSYEELRNRVRSEEYEIKLMKERSVTRPKTGKLNQTSVEIPTTRSEDMMAKLMKKIEDLDRKFEEMKEGQEKVKNSETVNFRGGYRRPQGGGNRGSGRGRPMNNSQQTCNQDGREDTEIDERVPLNM